MNHRHSILISLAMVVSPVAFAQTSSIPAPQVNQDAIAESPSATTTLTTQIEESKDSEKKKFTGAFVVNAFSMVNDVKENGNGAMIDSTNSLGGFYSPNENIRLGINHNFGVRAVGDSKQLADFGSDNGVGSGYKTMDPTLHFDYSMKPFYGSNPFKILTRYYVPVSPESQAEKSNGVLRTQAFITWTLNPRIDVSFYGQARLYMNSSENKNQAQGSDSVLRTIAGPVLGYNFNDMWNVYYNPYLDLKSTDYQRGRFNADTTNNLAHEAGIWITLASGKFIINPAWVTTASKLGNESYEGTGSDANTEYDLNLMAYF